MLVNDGEWWCMVVNGASLLPLMENHYKNTVIGYLSPRKFLTVWHCKEVTSFSLPYPIPTLFAELES